MLAIAYTAAVLSFSLPCRPPAYAAHGRASVHMKRAAAVDEDAPPPQLETVGSIMEFDDGKHGRALLGVVSSAEAKAKGGARYTVVDEDEKTHTVQARDVHATFSCSKQLSDNVAPAEILKEYLEVAEADPTELGVDATMLEMAWEICAEDEEHDQFTPTNILGLIDAKLTKGSIAQYKAFRLLTSDLGKVFFKALSHGRYRAKNFKSVQGSKENWCSSHADAELCMV